MIDPGQLRARLVLQRPIEAADDQGGVVRTWESFGSAWAKVVPRSSRYEMDADSTGATQDFTITLRANFSLTLQHRLVDGGKIYRITAIRDARDRGFIELDAELRIE